MRLRVFGGTFDPIHAGHKRTIAQSVMADGVLVIAPTTKNPWKDREPTSLEVRLEMIEAVLEALGVPHSREAFLRGGVFLWTAPYQYSAEVLTMLRQSFGATVPIEWVVGPDVAPTVSLWRDWSTLGCPLHIVPEVVPVHSTDIRLDRSLLLPELRPLADRYQLYRPLS